MTTKTLDQHIAITPGVSGAKPRIAGHAVTVQEIVVLHQRIGKPAEEIAAEHKVTLADVHAALAYYFDHQAEMDRAMDEDESSSEPVVLSPGQHLTRGFLFGFGSVLEFFPSPDRFDAWRLRQDISLHEWPRAVRNELSDFKDDSQHEDPA